MFPMLKQVVCILSRPSGGVTYEETWGLDQQDYNFQL
jgi:hypothetical protein